MRRPLALAGITFFICNLYCVCLGEALARFAAIFAGVLFVVLLIALKRSPHNRLLQSLCGCSIFACSAFVMYLLAVSIHLTPLEPLHESQQTIEMTVVQQDSSYDTTRYYIVKTKNLYAGTRKTARIRLQVDSRLDLEIQPGDVLKGEVILKSISDEKRTRLYGDSIWMTAKPVKNTILTVIGTEKNVDYYAGKARSYLQQYFYRHLHGETAAMVTGICLGNTAGLSDASTADFYACGMGHLVAVSGLHTNTVGSMFIALFLFMNTRKRFTKLCSLVFVWSFVAITGFSYPAIRAGIMFTMFAGGMLFHRQMDSLNTLGGAALLILFLHPMAAGSIGFVTSVATCMSIILLTDFFARNFLRLLPKSMRVRKICVFIAQSLGVTVSAWFALLPINLLGFYSASLIAPAANLIGVPLAAVILSFGLVSAFLSVLPGIGYFSWLVLSVAGMAAKGLLRTAHFLGALPFASVQQATVWCLLGMAVLTAGAFVLWHKRNQWRYGLRRAVAIGLIVMLIACSFMPAYTRHEYEIMIVGSEYDSALAIAGREGTVVIGCYNPYSISKLLGSRGIRSIDYWILPSRQTYSNQLHQMLSCFKVETVVTGTENQKRGLLTGLENQYNLLSATQKVQLGAITVTADASFGTFVITINDTVLSYSDKVDVFPANAPYMVVRRQTDSTEKETCLLVAHEQAYTQYTLQKPLILRVKNQTVTQFTPVFFYG